jgi:hypothetical protein
VGKSFDEYKAEHLKEPFPLPMPDGGPVMIPQPDVNAEREAFTAANAAGAAGGTYADGLLAGLAVYAGEQDGKRIAEAYGQLPAAVLAAVVSDMREHFGQGNSVASPSS